MITLGLDPSLTGFGWCIFDSRRVGPARVIAKGRWSTSSDEIFIARYVSLREEVQRLLNRYLVVEAVGVESPPYGELWSEGLYALFTHVNEAIWRCRKDVVYFDPGTVKMLAKEDPALRKGKMFKSDMVDAAKMDTAIARWNSDEADAYHVSKSTARFWLFYHGKLKLSDLTPSEYQAFAKIHTFTRGKRKGQTVKQGAVFKENHRFFRFSLLPKDKPHGR